jgi:hypothetical protein
MKWNVSRMWSVEYVNAAVGQTLDLDHGRGVDAEKRLVAASRGTRRLRGCYCLAGVA